MEVTDGSSTLVTKQARYIPADVTEAVLEAINPPRSSQCGGDRIMAIVKDFWAEPAYADLLIAMQQRLHNYVIAGQGTAEEALDGLTRDWTEVFEDEGKL